VDSILTTVATFSEPAACVFASLFLADLVVVCIYIYRIGNVDSEEGHGVTENRPLTDSDWNSLGGTGTVGGKYWGKHRVFLSRSGYITDMSLVDGTATKKQHRIVRGIKLAAVLFWLAWVCGALCLLPLQPAVGLTFAIGITIWFLGAIRLVRKGRADALHKLAERRASRHDRHKP
jgi:hypothetical protein